MEGLKILAVDVTPHAAANVIETAVNAGATFGIGYWASVTAVEHFALEGEKREAVYSIKVYDHEGGGATDSTPDSVFKTQGRKDRVIITVEHVKKAIAKMLSDPHACDAEGWVPRLLSDDPDGPMADAIVQVACFGKVIYG